MKWRQFQSLSNNFRELQLSLLKSGVPEEMTVKGLAQWGKLLSSCIQYSHAICNKATLPEDERIHWVAIRTYAVNQLTRVGDVLTQLVEDADTDDGTGLLSHERCIIFDLAGICSSCFQLEAEAMRAELELSGKLTELPDTISEDALKALSNLNLD